MNPFVEMASDFGASELISDLAASACEIGLGSSFGIVVPARIGGPKGSIALPLDQRCSSSRASLVRWPTVSGTNRIGGVSIVLNDVPQTAQKTR